MITGKTNVVGVIGDPVEHSLSPIMHNAAFNHLKLDYVYVAFHVKKGMAKEAIEAMKTFNIKGLNVTIPHKVRILKYIDEIDETAKLIGAVNTLKLEKGKVWGFNTDGIGCVRALEEVTNLKGKNVIILGAGGASRAITFQLASSNVGSLHILNRTPENAKKIAEDIKEKLGIKVFAGGLEHLKEKIGDADILINTTPVGMYPNIDARPLATADILHENLIVKDLVYNPPQTRLLKEAEKAGAKTISGIKMLVYQGAESFKIWTGKEAPTSIMEKAILKTIR
ncbi:shikimate dehydrogenase [Methanothermobacter tenebrarum]|uniref:Shikimate dehydrogenase (NADP(+)) n=1 Tax=Methanothermobacter tenebrarum TaxID=680118 RepID=A0A328P8L8_9EURY|nr:shikimate dehydrogenase [Methanothermobacter tenebrarum]NPV64526.1 shikimate dehydrogenase [Methanobacteriaceae archaeon]RAO78758.1 shikimate dehydrogenase [Methanothermobacter tenebrarum]